MQGRVAGAEHPTDGHASEPTGSRMVCPFEWKVILFDRLAANTAAQNCQLKPTGATHINKLHQKENNRHPLQPAHSALHILSTLGGSPLINWSSKKNSQSGSTNSVQFVHHWLDASHWVQPSVWQGMQGSPAAHCETHVYRAGKKG